MPSFAIIVSVPCACIITAAILFTSLSLPLWVLKCRLRYVCCICVLVCEYLTGEQEEPKRQKVREPYTREELEAVYDRKIEAEVRIFISEICAILIAVLYYHCFCAVCLHHYCCHTVYLSFVQSHFKISTVNREASRAYGMEISFRMKFDKRF